MSIEENMPFVAVIFRHRLTNDTKKITIFVAKKGNA